MGVIWDGITRSFEVGSSKIDWCEPNYVVTSHIAEFYNTVTNVLYLLVPMLMMYLYKDYSTYVTRGCHVVHVLVMVIGLGSAHFHGWLSLAGQLVDELAILWVSGAALALWMPEWALSRSLAQHRGRFHVMMLMISLVGTCLGFVYPAVNNVVLTVCAVPTVMIIYKEANSCREAVSRRLGARSCLLWVAAVIIWISDQVVCSFWIRIGFPYLHAIWHVMMIFASYGVITFLAYRDAVARYGHLQPWLTFWPSDKIALSLPYIKFRADLPITQLNKPVNKAH